MVSINHDLFHILVIIVDIQTEFNKLSKFVVVENIQIVAVEDIQVVDVEDTQMVIMEDIRVIVMEDVRVMVENFKEDFLVMEGLNKVDIQINLVVAVFHIMVEAFLLSMVIHQLILRFLSRLYTFL